MANLSSLVKSKSQFIPAFDEDNLLKGEIFVFTLPEQTAGFGNFTCFCWPAPAAGKAIVEIWGAAGSGGGMCCCGVGMPGNPGAYAKKTLCVEPGDYLFGLPGNSCKTPALCFRGCSEPTCVCWVTNSGNGTMCAAGGRGGESRCLNSATGNMYDCFVSLGFSGTSFGSGCGLICNHNSSINWIASATGGDINLSGGFSCLKLMACNTATYCCFTGYVKTSPHVVSEDGAIMEVRSGYNSESTKCANPLPNMMTAMAGVTKSPFRATPYSSCIHGALQCAQLTCYGVAPILGLGVPSPHVIVSSGNAGTDVGIRGAQGAVRIQFIKSISS